MDITGAPEYTWHYCGMWLCDIHNISANEHLGYITPLEKRHGITPDISAYILFHFWEEILYLDTDIKYPYSKELPGNFIGVAKNTGDALTFTILTKDKIKLTRSVIRSATGKPLSGFPNLRTTDMSKKYKYPMSTVEITELDDNGNAKKDGYENKVSFENPTDEDGVGENLTPKDRVKKRKFQSVNLRRSPRLRKTQLVESRNVNAMMQNLLRQDLL